VLVVLKGFDTGRPTAPFAPLKEGCAGCDHESAPDQESPNPALPGGFEFVAGVMAADCTGAKPESRTVLFGGFAFPVRPIVALEPPELFPQLDIQSSAGGGAGRFVLVADDFAGSASTLCNCGASFAATEGNVGPGRTAVVPEPPKFAIVIGDCGTKSGGAATAVPMLVQPPLIGVTPAELALTVLPIDGVAGQLPLPETEGAVGVFVHGDETPVLLVVIGGAAATDVENGFVTCPLTLLIPC
jgi:hypothetical protein